MSMFIVDGKTFIKKFIKENPEKVLSTQFVIVSSTIRKLGKARWDKQVINSNTLLYPPQNLIMEYDDYKHDEEYKREYFNYLDRAKPLLATLIKYVIESDYTVVFLCGKKEMKYNYLNLIRKYIKSEFGFHVYNYEKVKKGKEKPSQINESHTLKLCNKILKQAKNDKKHNMLQTERGRKEYFSKMSKKELKKELKKMGLYDPSMDKEELIDMLETFA